MKPKSVGYGFLFVSCRSAHGFHVETAYLSRLQYSYMFCCVILQFCLQQTGLTYITHAVERHFGSLQNTQYFETIRKYDLKVLVRAIYKTQKLRLH